MFLYEKTHRYLKNDCQFFDALKIKERKIRGNWNFLTEVNFHELEWSSPLTLASNRVVLYRNAALSILALST